MSMLCVFRGLKDMMIIIIIALNTKRYATWRVSCALRLFYHPYTGDWQHQPARVVHGGAPPQCPVVPPSRLTKPNFGKNKKHAPSHTCVHAPSHTCVTLDFETRAYQ